MPWQVQLLEDRQIVRTCYQGLLSATELEDACRETIAVAGRADTHCYLTDCRGLSGGHTLADLFFLIDFLVAAGLDPHLSREAIICDATPDIVEKMEFWENAMVNRGFKCRRFSDYDDAIAWLSA